MEEGEFKMRLLKATLAGFGLAVLGIAAAANAGAVPWSNPSGTVPGFFSWSNGQSDNGLFGSPIVAANSFTFFPSNFRATGTNGSAQTTTDRLSFTLDVAPGQVFDRISVTELGDFSIVNGGTVSAEAFLFVTNLNGPVGPGNPNTSQMTTNPAFPLSTVGNANGLWDGFVQANILANGWTRVQVVLNNILQAVGGPNGTATIEKKVAGITITVFIPEPGTIGVLAGGLGMLMLRRRK
jgi:hypothetical protein